MSTDPTAAAPADHELDDEDEEPEIHARDLGALVRFLRPYAASYRRSLLLLALVLLVETIFNFLFPLASQFLIDKGLGGEAMSENGVPAEKDFSVVIGVIIFLAVGSVAVTVLGVAMDYLNARVFTGVVVDIRQKLFATVQGLSMPFFTRTRAGEVLSRFSGDLVALEGTLLTMVPWCLVPLLEVVYSVVVMLYLNVWLGLMGCLIFPLVLLAPRIFAAWAFALSYDKRRREADLLGAVQENVTAQAVVKAFGMEPPALSRFHGLNLLWRWVAFRVHFLGELVERSSNSGVYLLHVLCFGVGAYWVYSDRITIGTLVAFEGTFLSMGYALTYVAQYVPAIAQAAGSIYHLDELFAERPLVADAPDAVELPRLEREIAFEGVSFGYPGGAFQLHDFSVRIAKGSLIAFVGSSGSGKSTVLNLLLRLYDPSQGAVRVDGRDIRTVTQASLRRQIGMVFQDCFLFNTSILENIRMGRPEASEEEVAAAARAAEIHDFIAGLPQGYHTIVGERGSQLSGGQRQRLAIARALVRDPAILVLDEATSALDYATEAALNDTLLRVAQNRTVVMVTHRLSSVVSAAHIVVLDRGNIAEAGTHEELLGKNGAYAALWRHQLQQAEPVADLCATDRRVGAPDLGLTDMPE